MSSATKDSRRETTIGVVSFPGVTMLDVAGPVEVFARAGGYRVHYFSPAGGTVTASTGLAFANTVPLPHAQPVDSLIITGANNVGDLDQLRDHHAELARLASTARRVASVGTGSFVLAQLGLLDGRRASTHWQETEALARRHPNVQVEHDEAFVRDGRFLTSGGMTTGIDVALALVEEDLGAATARDIASDLFVYLRCPGAPSQFSDTAYVSSVRHQPLRRAMSMVVEDPAAAHTAASMARSAHMSSRHLNRLMLEETGMSPARWIERVRLEVARRLLQANYSVTDTALQSGFRSDETLRRAFRRHMHTTPTEYRNRYRSS